MSNLDDFVLPGSCIVDIRQGMNLGQSLQGRGHVCARAFFICIDLAQRLSQNRYIDQKTVRFFVSAN